MCNRSSMLALALAAAAALACGAGEDAPPATDARALGPVPASYTAPQIGAGEILGKQAEQRCGTDRTSFVWRSDGTFLATSPAAKFGGRWSLVDADLVYLTDGPMGEGATCTAARFLLGASGQPEALLCGRGPLGCSARVAWAVEVLDAGGDPAMAELVARALGGVDASFGPGVVIAGNEARAAPGTGLLIRFRSSDGAARRLAEHVALLLARDLRQIGEPSGPIAVRAEAEPSSPVVIDVRGTWQAAAR